MERYFRKYALRKSVIILFVFVLIFSPLHTFSASEATEDGANGEETEAPEEDVVTSETNDEADEETEDEADVDEIIEANEADETPDTDTTSTIEEDEEDSATIEDEMEEENEASDEIEEQEDLSLKMQSLISLSNASLIPDDSLRQAINEELGEAEDYEPTEADLASITVLDASDRGITDLTGLEHAIYLVELNLDKNNIVDIGALASMPYLYDLVLNFNKVNDLSPLANLTNLTKASFFDNEVSDVSDLADLTQLEYLNLTNNDISTISDLVDLTNLESLYLDYNHVEDFSSIASMNQLTSLGARSNGITDITTITNMPIERLFLSDNPITNIELLSGMTQLTSLDISGMGVTDLNILANLTELRVLSLGRNEITDISVLKDLDKVYQLGISYNYISDFSPLKDRIGDYHTLWADYQDVILPEVELDSSEAEITIDNPIINYDGTLQDNFTGADVEYQNEQLTWTNLSGTETSVTVDFSDSGNGDISGTITLPIKWVDGDDEAPVIHAEDQMILQDESFDSLVGVSATDDEDGDLTNVIQVTQNDVDTSIPGDYTVTYEVTDSANQTVSKTIQVEVLSAELIIPLDVKTAVFAGQIGQVEGTGTTIEFPSDLPNGTFITVTDQGGASIVSDLTELERAGDVLDFEFDYPAGESYVENFELHMSYGNGVATPVDIYYYDETTQEWVAQNGTMNPSENTITIEPEHFSTYGVLAKAEEEQPGTHDPNNGEREELPNGSNDELGDDSGDKDKDKDSLVEKVSKDDEKLTTEKKQEGDILPKTATNTFNLLMIGFGLLVLGSVLYFIRTRQKA